MRKLIGLAILSVITSACFGQLQNNSHTEDGRTTIEPGVIKIDGVRVATMTDVNAVSNSGGAVSNWWQFEAQTPVVFFTSTVYGAANSTNYTTNSVVTTNTIMTTNVVVATNVVSTGTTNDLAVYGTLTPDVAGLFARDYYFAFQPAWTKSTYTIYQEDVSSNHYAYVWYGDDYWQSPSSTKTKTNAANFAGTYTPIAGYATGTATVVVGPYITTNVVTTTNYPVTTNITTNVTVITNYTYASTNSYCWRIGADTNKTYISFNSTNKFEVYADGTIWPSAAQGTYPMFLLDVGNVDGNWTDFELKGSTNNFTNLVYYIQSWTNANNAAGDTNVLVYFTDDFSPDVRVWRQKTNASLSIGQNLYDQTTNGSVVGKIIVLPSHNCSNLWSNWMNATNEHLVWAWVRNDAIGNQKNAQGTQERWNPAEPIWKVERTIP